MKTFKFQIIEINNEQDLDKASERIDYLVGKTKSKDEEIELNFITHLVIEFERLNYPIEIPDPIELIKEEMEDRGWVIKDLAKIVGHKSVASEILNKKRPLSLKIMKALNQEFKISYDILIMASMLGETSDGRAA